LRQNNNFVGNSNGQLVITMHTGVIESVWIAIILTSLLTAQASRRLVVVLMQLNKLPHRRKGSDF